MTSHQIPLNTKITMTYEVSNPGPGFGQAQISGAVKPVNEIPCNIPFFITGSPTAIHIKTNDKNTAEIRFYSK